LGERIRAAQEAGIKTEQIVIDPGIGFGKPVEPNLLLLKNIDTFCSMGIPVLLGMSRKAFIGKLLNREHPEDRVFGTAAAAAWGILHGVQILSVHDVTEIWQIREMLSSIQGV